MSRRSIASVLLVLAAAALVTSSRVAQAQAPRQCTIPRSAGTFKGFDMGNPIFEDASGAISSYAYTPVGCQLVFKVTRDY